MASGQQIQATGRSIAAGGRIIAADTDPCCCGSPECYQKFTAIYDCSTGVWSGPTAGAKLCKTAPNTDWVKTGSAGTTCTYTIYVDLGSACTVDSDCTSLTDASPPALPFGGGLPPDCCFTTSPPCDACLPAPSDGDTIPIALDITSLIVPDPTTDVPRCGAVYPIDSHINPAAAFKTAGNLTFGGGAWTWLLDYTNADGNAASILYEVHCEPCGFPTTSVTLHETVTGGYLDPASIVTGFAPCRWVARIAGSVTVNDGTFTRDWTWETSGFYAVPLNCVGGKPSGTFSVPVYIQNGSDTCCEGEYAGNVVVTV